MVTTDARSAYTVKWGQHLTSSEFEVLNRLGCLNDGVSDLLDCARVHLLQTIVHRQIKWLQSLLLQQSLIFEKSLIPHLQEFHGTKVSPSLVAASVGDLGHGFQVSRHRLVDLPNRRVTIIRAVHVLLELLFAGRDDLV